MTDRRAFAPVNEEENKIALDEGIRIYKELLEKFKCTDEKGCDLMMNTLCSSLICFLRVHVPPDNMGMLLQVIHKILVNNVNK
jgi:hypothetical protein